jgi:hypothetical protein
MPTLAHHPTPPAPERPAPRPTGRGSDPPKTPPTPIADAEESQTFLRVLLRALGVMHT